MLDEAEFGSDCSVLMIYGLDVDTLLDCVDDAEYPTDELSPVMFRTNGKMNILIL